MWVGLIQSVEALKKKKKKKKENKIKENKRWKSPEEEGILPLDGFWTQMQQQLLTLTLCDPMDCNPSGFSVHGIFHARILEWVAISFSRGSF